ncbi:aspartate/glutamate racemase family protein [Caenimonas aquaedulcis]|uniref:Aspartate/glutamate racemase family protein n=1 Tax=Caenimonas aquaedulcis TaxID=2793270 RepID=A0A931H3S9_9BURK|nr:aspartate/glutamate racemase family protein [Caenimonas aquaedulcis]MBG9387968.1 aspartate/glutamate racemase family protein [Caenimonas aquaedulcis]
MTIIEGGRNIYEAAVGVIVLDTKLPRAHGDIANARTWPFPMLYRVARGASAHVVVHERGQGLSKILVDTAKELVASGARGITTTGGFLSLFQQELSAECGVPVASSSLMQVPLVQNLLPPGRRVGVVTVQGARLGPDHLIAAGAPGDTPVVGTEEGEELTRVLLKGEATLDLVKAERDVVDAGKRLVERHPDVGAIVLECHNMAPYAAALSRAVRLPVYDLYSFIVWFQAGLQPREFDKR